MAAYTKVYIDSRKEEQTHELEAVQEVAGLFLATESQVRELLQTISVQVSEIAEETERLAKRGMRFQTLKILKMVVIDQIRSAGEFISAYIQDNATAAGMVMTGAHRKFRSQAAEVVSLRNQLKKAFLGDNPGWEIEKMQMERKMKDLRRALRRLQEENVRLRHQLEELGVLDDADGDGGEEEEEEDPRDRLHRERLERVLARKTDHRLLSWAWVRWLRCLRERQQAKARQDRAAAADRLRQAEQRMRQLAQQGAGSKAAPLPAITSEAETQTDRHRGLSEMSQTDDGAAPSPPAERRKAPRQYFEAKALQAHHLEAHRTRVAARMQAGRLARSRAAFFLAWREMTARKKRDGLLLGRFVKRLGASELASCFVHWRDLTQELRTFAEWHHKRNLLRRMFQRFYRNSLRSDSQEAVTSLRAHLEEQLLKVVAVACHERELRGDLEVLLEEALAILVRCMEGELDRDRALHSRLKAQVGRILDARWIVRKWSEDSGADAVLRRAHGSGSSQDEPAPQSWRPWKQWDSPCGLKSEPSKEANGAGEGDPAPDPPLQTSEDSRRKMYLALDDLRRKHVGLPVSLRPEAGKLPRGEELPQPDGSLPPQPIAVLHAETASENGPSLSVGDWEVKAWKEGWAAFKGLTDSLGALLHSIGSCPPTDFWKGFWTSWAHTNSDEHRRQEAGELMDTLHGALRAGNSGRASRNPSFRSQRSSFKTGSLRKRSESLGQELSPARTHSRLSSQPSARASLDCSPGSLKAEQSDPPGGQAHEEEGVRRAASVTAPLSHASAQPALGHTGARAVRDHPTHHNLQGIATGQNQSTAFTSPRHSPTERANRVSFSSDSSSVPCQWDTRGLSEDGHAQDAVGDGGMARLGTGGLSESPSPSPAQAPADSRNKKTGSPLLHIPTTVAHPGSNRSSSGGSKDTVTFAQNLDKQLDPATPSFPQKARLHSPRKGASSMPEDCGKEASAKAQLKLKMRSEPPASPDSLPQVLQAERPRTVGPHRPSLPCNVKSTRPFCERSPDWDSRPSSGRVPSARSQVTKSGHPVQRPASAFHYPRSAEPPSRRPHEQSTRFSEAEASSSQKVEMQDSWSQTDDWEDDESFVDERLEGPSEPEALSSSRSPSFSPFGGSDIYASRKRAIQRARSSKALHKRDKCGMLEMSLQ
eukprot:CAMPEP_0177621574 /NCGR_PEP_ID=MMETSP0419_2-20121207/27658_1 /TAXON_ID=582737 /ORGANISM="Tetraselmis sp., Strain GSL018" /LENGTH=1160 /DNA_ID=CAMNT_0019121501 /DNA_START=506 /DNA_END=3988 /DNA_ORIENTATION=+